MLRTRQSWGARHYRGRGGGAEVGGKRGDLAAWKPPRPFLLPPNLLEDPLHPPLTPPPTESTPEPS